MSGAATARDVLLISPHCDDIAYSMAGRLLAGREDPRRCHMEIVFSVSAFAPYAEPPLSSVEAITARRASEDASFARALGLERGAMGLEEAPIRDGITDVDGLFVTDAVAQNHPFARTLRGYLRPLLRRSWSRIYAPLGLGGLLDHLLVRDAVLIERPPGAALFLYEDQPYAGELSDAEYHREVARLARGMTPDYVAEDGWLIQKTQLLRLYRTQVAEKDVAAVMRATQRIGGERAFRRA
ncbi:hypothetical protein WMF20_28515 [Sorangium sp. So ce834]|uniref:hypothetical protein n=1 Tax=Sorangium sp. So ce834 TaxID=3133321 RepID=UPI003F5F071A